MNETNQQANQPPRSAMQILGEIRRGNMVEEIGYEIARLTQQVLQTDKGGTLTLKLTIKPSDVADNAVEIKDKITVKAPEPEMKASVFYANADGALTRSDPNQEELPLGATNLRAVKSA